MKNCKAAGTRREHQTMRWMEDDGWVTIRSPASLGAADFWALQANAPTYAVQVKANKDGGAYKSFGPAERRELREVAERAGAIPVLVWWPPRGERHWIESADWPQERTPA